MQTEIERIAENINNAFQGILPKYNRARRRAVAHNQNFLDGRSRHSFFYRGKWYSHTKKGKNLV